jgi:hypothetical protein
VPDNVGTLEVSGTELTVKLSANGTFNAYLDGQYLCRAESLDDLKRACQRELKTQSAKVSVPFLTRQYERREATGIHSGMNKVIVRGGSVKVEYYETHAKVWSVRMPAEKQAEYTDRLREIARLRRLQQAIEEEYEFQIGAEVRGAIRAAVQKEMAEA